jgi:hypothetical protein
MATAKLLTRDEASSADAAAADPGNYASLQREGITKVVLQVLFMQQNHRA